MRKGYLCWLAVALGSPLAWAQPYAGPLVTNDLGGVGLLQTPSAQFPAAGDLRVGYGEVLPFRTVGISVHPFNWLESTFRYTLVSPRERPGFPAGGGTRDRAFDLRLRLLREGSFTPAVALGVHDIVGTGLFSSEYLAASKSFGDFSTHLGLAWGRLGSRGDFRNPFISVSNSFEQRQRQFRQGGGFEYKRLFSGERVGLFGGVIWRPRQGPLALIVERDGNDWQSEARGNNQPVDWPVNVGLSYRWTGFELGVAYQRGDLFTFQVTVVANVAQDTGPAKFLDEPFTPVAPPHDYPRQPIGRSQTSDEAFVEALRAALARQRYTLIAVELVPESDEVIIWYSQLRYGDAAESAERVARAFAALAPYRYQRATAVEMRHGLELFRITRDREHILSAAANAAAPAAPRTATVIAPPQPPPRQAQYDGFVSHPRVTWDMGPRVRQFIGGPDGTWFGQLWWSMTGQVHLTEHWSLRSSIGLDIVNNFDRVTVESDSVLPRVRSDVAEYLKQGRNNLVRLETNYIRQLAPSWYGRLSAGIFEEMFGGVAGEVLYRPEHRSWAAGVNVNRVRQREFRQRLGFQEYEVTTGHLSLYYDYAPLQVLATISAGYYLAGDRGVTLDFARRFANGARFGVWSTFTNVSAADFGEGSFDKGFYISVPLDLFLPRSTTSRAGLAFRPLSRDGGQKVVDGMPLYTATGGAGLYGGDRMWGGH